MITLNTVHQTTLEYSFCGQFVSNEQWIHPTRIIDTYEALLVTQGEVFLLEEGREYHLTAGDLIILRPGVQHGGFRPSLGRTSFFWAHFHTNSLQALGLQPGFHHPDQPDRLTSAFRCLLHIGNAPEYPSFATDAAMTSLLAEIAASQTRSGSDSSRMAHEVAEWIRINSNKKLTVQSVADQFTYHPDYLCTLMKASFGKGLKEYISQERMKLIKTLLLTTNLSVKELVARLDFGSENQLVHYFKYHEGISPARFRNQYVNTHLNRQ